ncbi:MAG: hypothetical protein IJ588_06475 [Prevotella sp.]|nr:hypothetical protein [Prevotella sp.]
MAEQIIEEEKLIMAPAYKDIDKQKLEFEKVEIEQRVERKDLQPDIVGVTSDGLRWCIEIRNTHEVDEAKRKKIIESSITCLEIDVRGQELENLKSFLLESARNRKWINNPIYDSQIAKAKCIRVAQVEKLLFDKKEFVVPEYRTEYRKYDSKKVYFDNLSVLLRSADGLFVRVKATSIEGIPYLFDIGSKISLDSIIPSLQKEPDCNELVIDTDSVYSDTNIASCFLDVRWLYNNLSEKGQNTTLREKSQKHEEPVVQFQNTMLSNCLPSDMFWMIDEFYSQLQSTNTYETEEGLLVEIVKYERTIFGVLLLYKDPCEVRVYCPYHLVIINVSDGDLNPKEIAVYPNRKEAITSYYKRLIAMQNNCTP